MKILYGLILCLLLSPALAATPVGPMNYQGRLLDNSGIPVTGTVNFVVRVYDAESGGTLKYQEAHNSVAVDDGVYAFLVGTQTPTGGTHTWSVELWNCCSALYLEIAVNGETLTPRHRLAAAPFAFQANLALTTNNALALGGKPSSWYNSTLEAICASGKGKWLELANDGAGACLGAGSSFPGPTQVSYLELTTNGDFSNLDLTNADISGILFDDATFTGTLFKNTTFSVAGISGANLRNTVWEGAVSADLAPHTLAANTNLSGATFKKMNMSNWDLSALNSGNYDMLSAAYLIGGCPESLPLDWECRLMRANGSNYFLLGPYANLSVTSAASTTSLGESYLDVDTNALDNVNLDYASLVGNVIRQNLLNAHLYGADLSYTAIRDVSFQGSGTWMAGTKFISAKLERVTFGADVFMSAPDFSKADLRQVRFLVPAAGQNFTGASLYEVDFYQVAGLTNFTDATFNNVSIDYLVGNITPWESVFRRVKIYGQFHVRDIADGGLNEIIFEDLTFIRATWSGDFRGAIFTGTTTFRDTRFDNLNLCGATIPLVDTDVPYDDLARVTFRTTLCPNNYVGSCNTNASPAPMSPIADINQCYKLGIPDANGDGIVDP